MEKYSPNIHPSKRHYLNGWHPLQTPQSNLQNKDIRLSKFKIETTLKTHSGECIQRFHFWSIFHFTLYPEQIISLSLYNSVLPSVRWRMGAVANFWGLFQHQQLQCPFASRVFNIGLQKQLRNLPACSLTQNLDHTSWIKNKPNKHCFNITHNGWMPS